MRAAALFALLSCSSVALAQDIPGPPTPGPPFPDESEVSNTPTTDAPAEAGIAEAPEEAAEPTPTELELPGTSSEGGELALFNLAENIETLTVTGVSRREERVQDAPATITVITREDFERHGWRNVAEALRSVPGIYVSNGREYYFTGVRGLSFPRDVDTRILVLLDGHTLNNAWSSSSNTGELLSVPPLAIERVEVIRGPSSSIYGSNAFFAVVNIVTRTPAEEGDDVTRVVPELLFGSTGVYRATLAAHHRVDELSFSGYAVGMLGDGPDVQFDDMTRPQRNRGALTPTDGRTWGTDYERGFNLGATGSWRGLTLQLVWAERWRGIASASGDAIFNDPYNSVRDDQAFVELRYRTVVEGHEILARVYYDHYENRRFLHRDPSDWDVGRWFSGDPRIVSEGNGDSGGLTAQSALALHEMDTLIAGGELQYHFVTQPTYELDPDTGTPIVDSIAGGVRDENGNIQPIEYANAALYLQNDLRPIPELGIVVGIRFDYNSLFSRLDEDFLSALAPRAAIVIRPISEITLKLLYGEAFRYPSVFEAFFDDGASVCGNPAARAERVRTGEIEGTFRLHETLTGTLSGFFTGLSGLLVSEAVDPCYAGSGTRQQFVNRGDVLVGGGEAALDLRIPGGVSAFAAAAVTWVEQTSGGTSGRPPNSPLLVASAGTSVPLLTDRLFVSFRAQLFSERLAWTLDRSSPEGPALRLEAALVARRLAEGLRASVTGALTADLAEPRLGYRDPVTASETIPTAMPQDEVALYATLGYEW